MRGVRVHGAREYELRRACTSLITQDAICAAVLNLFEAAAQDGQRDRGRRTLVALRSQRPGGAVNPLECPLDVRSLSSLVHGQFGLRPPLCCRTQARERSRSSQA